MEKKALVILSDDAQECKVSLHANYNDALSALREHVKSLLTEGLNDVNTEDKSLEDIQVLMTGENDITTVFISDVVLAK